MAKVNEKSLASWPLAYFYSAMQAFDFRMGDVETETQRFLSEISEVHRLYTVFDEAYKRSAKSQLTEQIAALDEIRDHYANIVEKVSNIWAEQLKNVDDTLAVKGRRIHQPFVDFEFDVRESMVAENSKLDNIFQVFASQQLQQDLTDLGLTVIDQRLRQTTQQLKNLISQRNQESAGVEKGELKAAREALYQKYVACVTYINALQEIAPEESISQYVEYYNTDLGNIERQMKQGKKNPTVLVNSVVVGNHRYSVSDYAKWSDIAASYNKDFTIDTANNRLLSAYNKAKKVGGMYLALKGVAVKPTDAVDAKKTYTLLLMDGTEPQPEPDDDGGEVTPVTPE